MNIPNFFRFASSELSQDAFILWLLEWANPKPEYIQEDYELHKAAQAFVRLLLFPDGSKEELYISSIECKGQDNNIDVLALIKDDINQNKYAVIIEDKTDSTVHDNQLVRYSKDVRKRYKDEDGWQLHCVYFKTGNESKYSLSKIEQNYQNDEWVRANNLIFKKVLREDILMVLNQFSTKNIIFTDFRNNLDRIQRWTKSYKNANKVVDEWGNTAWQGFYMALENVLNSELNKDKQEWEDKIYCKWDSEPKGEKRKNKKKKEISRWYLQLPKLSIIDDQSICLYLYLKLDELNIKAYCKDGIRPLAGWSNILSKFAEIKVDGLNVIPIKNVSNKGDNVTLCKIKQERSEFIDEDLSYPDLNKLTSLLLELHKQLSTIASELKQNYCSEK